MKDTKFADDVQSYDLGVIFAGDYSSRALAIPGEVKSVVSYTVKRQYTLEEQSPEFIEELKRITKRDLFYAVRSKFVEKNWQDRMKKAFDFMSGDDSEVSLSFPMLLDLIETHVLKEL